MMDALKDEALTMVDEGFKKEHGRIMSELWEVHNDDGSTLATSSLPHFPQRRDDGSYTCGDKTVTPTASEILWYKTFMKRHADPKHVKVINSQISLWADPCRGYIEMMKLFCNSLGGPTIVRNKTCVADFDAEAVFKTVHNFIPFHKVIAGSSENPVKTAAEDAGHGRNIIIHPPKPVLSRTEFQKVVKQFESFEKVLVQYGGVDGGKRTVHNIEWMEVSLQDGRYAEMIKAFELIKELRRQELAHNIIDQLLPPAPNALGSRQLLLQPVQNSISKLRHDWANGSREVLKAEIAQAAASDSRTKLIWLHGQRGRGKSSVMAQLIEPSAWMPKTFVLQHFFKRNDAASSLNVAVASICVQLWEKLSPNDFETAYGLFVNCMLASNSANLDVHELSAAINTQSLLRIMKEVFIKLLNIIEERTSDPVSIVMLFDALDEVNHMQFQSDGAAASSDPTMAKAKFQKPQDALYHEVFLPLCEAVAHMKNVSVVIVASSTQNLVAPTSPSICPIPIDDGKFSSIEDSRCIVAHKVKTYWPTCKWTADVAAILYDLIPCKSPDLRFLDERCKLVIQNASRFQGLQQDEETLPAEVKQYLKELVSCVSGMNLVEIVETYVFQEFHTAFPGVALDTWKQRVQVAFDFLVLAVFFGADSILIEMFHPLVCNSGQTLDELDTLLALTLSSIMLPAPSQGTVQFQPEYMDAFRKGASTLGGFGNIMKVMLEVYPVSRPSPANHTTELQQRFHCLCFPEMNDCFAKASSLTEYAERILDVESGRSRKLDKFDKSLLSLLTLKCTDASSCPRALMLLLKSSSSCFSSTDQSHLLRFYSRVCERLSDCVGLDRNYGLLQYQARDIASETAIFLKRQVCTEGQLKWCSRSCALLFNIFKFLSSNLPGFVAADVLSQTLLSMKQTFAMFPDKLRFFVLAMTHDAGIQCEHMMRELGLNETEIWNVRLLSQENQDCFLKELHQMNLCMVPPDSVTRTILMYYCRDDLDALQRLMDETQQLQLRVIPEHWYLYLLACKSISDGEACMQRMRDYGLPPDLLCWNVLMSLYCNGEFPSDSAKQECLRGVLQNIQDVGLQPDQASYNTLMSVYRTGEERYAVLEHMITQGVRPNVKNWNCVIAGYTRAEDQDAVLQRMLASGVTPDCFTCAHMMKSYTMGHERNLVMQSMINLGVTPNKVNWNFLMSGYRKGEERKVVLLRMMKEGCTPDVWSWDTVMERFRSDGLSLECLACFVAMEQNHVSPSTFTLHTVFKSLLDLGNHEACSTIAHIAARYSVSSSMVDHKIACPVLAGLAVLGEERHLLSFWNFCALSLSPSNLGWPGDKSRELLLSDCSRNFGPGWSTLCNLLERNDCATSACTWPPEELSDVSRAPKLIAEAAALASSYSSSSDTAAHTDSKYWKCKESDCGYAFFCLLLLAVMLFCSQQTIF